MRKLSLISAMTIALSWTAAFAHKGHEHATGFVRERMELMTDMGDRLLAISKRLRANKKLIASHPTRVRLRMPRKRSPRSFHRAVRNFRLRQSRWFGSNGTILLRRPRNWRWRLRSYRSSVQLTEMRCVLSSALSRLRVTAATKRIEYRRKNNQQTL